MAVGAKKGDSSKFMQVYQSIPDDLKKQVMATTLASITRSARGAEAGGFGFSEFAKTYDGLRTNPTVYGAVVKALGPESDQFLRDLYTVSKRITEARSPSVIPTTGASMQAYMQGVNPENLVSTLLKGLGKQAVTGAGAAVAGAPGAMAGSILGDAMIGGGKQGLEKAGSVFRGAEFQARLPAPEKAAAVANSPAYQAFAKYAGLPREVRGAITFLKGALLGADVATYQTTGPMSVLEQNRAKNKTSATPGGN